MKRKHEQSIIDAFFKYMKKKSINKNIISASLDGQDNLLQADYLFTNNTKFVLSEFKYQEADIKSEHKKDNAINMCIRLEDNKINKKRHLECHYIAWSEKLENGITIILNQYLNEVCNLNILNTNLLNNLQADYTKRIDIDAFITNFFNNKIGIEFSEFDSYIQWLLDSIDPTGGGSVELIINDSGLSKFNMLNFSSLKELKKWIDERAPDKEIKIEDTIEPNNNSGGMSL